MKLKTDDTSLITAQQPDAPTPETPDAAQSPRRSLWKTWIADLLLFCFTGIYVELCLHLCVYHKLDRHTIYLILFALQAGVFFSLLTSFLPKILRQIVGVLLVAVQVLFAEVQLVYQCIFGNFMPISQVSMGENVITNFNSQIFYAIFKNLPRIILLLLPLIAVIACLALRKVPTLKLRLRWKQAQASFALLLVLVLVTVGLLFVGRNKPFSVYKTLSNVNTSTDSSYRKVGMIATTVQELHYMYRNGYVDPESPDNFGGQSAAKLGEFVDVLYRIAGRPETDNSALPPDYESRSFNASYPYYDAVCWAYQTRILRQSDLLYTGYDEKMDYRGACMLIYRFAALAGINTNVDQSQLLQVMSDNSNLTREAAKAMLWCNQKDITSRDSNLDELLDAYNTRISRYQMTSFLFYLCTYELNLGS